MLLSGGGHAMAAGFTFEEAKLDEVRNFLNERMKDAVAENSAKVLKLDGALAINAVNLNLAAELEKAAPYGTGNSEPRFVLANVRLIDSQIVGHSHVRCIFDDGGFSPQKVFAMAFRANESALGQFFLNSRMKTMHVAVRFRATSWQGRDRIETQIDDAVLA
jgi:single-stranded-DNA-specific exonuclease